MAEFLYSYRGPTGARYVVFKSVSADADEQQSMRRIVQELNSL